MRVLMVEDEKYMAKATAEVLKKTTIPLIWCMMAYAALTVRFQAFMTSLFSTSCFPKWTA